MLVSIVIFAGFNFTKVVFLMGNEKIINQCFIGSGEKAVPD